MCDCHRFEMLGKYYASRIKYDRLKLCVLKRVSMINNPLICRVVKMCSMYLFIFCDTIGMSFVGFLFGILVR